jgi:hypothetical protein
MTGRMWIRALIVLLIEVGAAAQLPARDVEPHIPPTPDLRPRNVILLSAPVGIAPGLLGSVWSTELWIHNRGERAVSFVAGPCRLQLDCFRIIFPGQTIELETPPPDPAGSYSAIYLSEENARMLHFNLRTRDLSGDGAGVELPVVRGGEFRTGSMQLMNIPLAHGSRLTLRLFASPLVFPQIFTVRVFAETDEVPLRETEVRIELQAWQAIYVGLPLPSTTLTHLFENLPGIERVRVEIEPNRSDDSYWAFVSITNSETRQVTLVTPQ